MQVERVGRGLGDRFAGSGWVGRGARSHNAHSVLDRLGDWGVTGTQEASYLSGNLIPRAFPGGPVVKNPPCNSGDMGPIPGQRTKVPHVAEKLSLQDTTPMPKSHNERVRESPRPTAKDLA